MASCSFCKKESAVLFVAKDYNRKISENNFCYNRCPACGLISIDAIPDDLGKYYTQEYYKIPSLDKLKRVAKAERFKIGMVEKFIKTGSLLEVGPAFGVFACQAKDAGFDVDVIEMDERCCEFLKNEVGVNAVKSDEPHKIVGSMKKHDVIAMWHVLEHLANPWECLEAMAGNLKSGGVFVIATPNPESFQLSVLGKHWPHVDAPRHLNLMPQQNLSIYLKRFGLELVMLTTNDKGGRGWNNFGWQRYLMNRFSGKWMQRMFFVAGYLVSFPMAMFDRRGFNGSAYTAIYQKKAVI